MVRKLQFIVCTLMMVGICAVTTAHLSSPTKVTDLGSPVSEEELSSIWGATAGGPIFGPCNNAAACTYAVACTGANDGTPCVLAAMTGPMQKVCGNTDLNYTCIATTVSPCVYVSRICDLGVCRLISGTIGAGAVLTC